MRRESVKEQKKIPKHLLWFQIKPTITNRTDGKIHFRNSPVGTLKMYPFFLVIVTCRAVITNERRFL